MCKTKSNGANIGLITKIEVHDESELGFESELKRYYYRTDHMCSKTFNGVNIARNCNTLYTTYTKSKKNHDFRMQINRENIRRRKNGDEIGSIAELTYKVF